MARKRISMREKEYRSLVETRILGDKPDFAQLRIENPNYMKHYRDALSWASVVYDPNDFKDITLNYLEENGYNVKLYEKIRDCYFISIGKQLWIESNGGELSSSTRTWLAGKLEELKSKAKEEEPEAEVVVEVRPKTKPNMPLFVFQTIEDLILDDKYVAKEAQVIELMRAHELGVGEARDLSDRLRLAIEQLVNVRDPQVAENIEIMGSKRVAATLAALKNALDQVNTFNANRSAERAGKRKPKTLKEQKVAREVQNVKYKRADNEYGVISVPPTDVVGAKALLVFNTESRRVGIFKAATEQGLELRGTTVHNFNEETSIAKILRKPEQDLMAFRNAPNEKRVDILLRDNIRGVTHKMNGRLNEDMLLLRVYK